MWASPHLRCSHFYKILGTGDISPLSLSGDRSPRHIGCAGENSANVNSNSTAEVQIHRIYTGQACSVDSSTVSLFPSIDYLISNQVLDTLGLCMHSLLRVLLCYSCRMAMTSTMVAGHIKSHNSSYQVCLSLVRCIVTLKHAFVLPRYLRPSWSPS
jgi:hypothetical protein